MQSAPVRRQVTAEDYKQIEDRITFYIAELRTEGDPNLQVQTDASLTAFLHSLHNLGSGWKLRLYRLMNGQVDSGADTQLTRIWNKYLRESTRRRELREENVQSNQPYAYSLPAEYNPNGSSPSVNGLFTMDSDSSGQNSPASSIHHQQLYPMPRPLGRIPPTNRSAPAGPVYRPPVASLTGNAPPPGHGQQYQMYPTRFENPRYNPYGTTSNASPGYYAQQQYQNNLNHGYNWGADHDGNC
ncbi:hypothetical protein DFH09DRAFT_1125335 [Mycena vulgaris]|nr:hypothetical protein DFH09DRAFT_1125335 [Mycena vulgaris]